MDQPSKPINQFQGRNSIIQGRLRIQLGQAHAGKKAITLTAADLSGDVKISCTLTGSGATYGSITVDENMYASHTPGGLDANDVFAIANGELKVTTSRGEMYALQDGEVKGAGAKLNGTITAQSRLFASQPEDVVEFAYDHNGLRTQKKVTKANGTVETTDYTLHGKLVTHLRKGNNEMHFYYDGLKQPAFVKFNEHIYSYVHSLQGDIVALLDSDGNLVVEYIYDVWGNLLKTTGSLADTIGRYNPFRYRGYLWDEEVGAYCLEKRCYMPSMCRFLNADEAISCDYMLLYTNVYTYCINIPTSFADSTGLWPKWLETAAKVVSGVVAVGAAVAVAVCTAPVAVVAATVGFGAAVGGIVGGIANEQNGESYINGWIGGAVNGAIQTIASYLGGTAGFIFGGAIGGGIGSIIIDSLNNVGKKIKKPGMI